VVVGLLASLALLGLMLATGRRHIEFGLGHWVSIPHYDFWIKFEFDRLNVPFVLLTFILCGTISAFGARYMHRESGYVRFFVLFALFQFGMIVTSLACTIETLFAGWEMVGLSSALLVAFFQERPAPVRNGLRVWIVYRVSDAALLIASVVVHHLTGSGDFDNFLGRAAWPEGHGSLTGSAAFLVGLLLALAAAGKSALIPFSGWLPRAMEGPTPSSAVFYGSLSVHLGAFLLLRVSPILDVSPALCVVVVALGLSTALFASLVCRVQTDIKSALSFASLTQVGLIVAEIGAGFRYIALMHIIGHACLRTLQFVRAPTLLRDYNTIENAIGDQLPTGSARFPRRLSDRAATWFYRFALERGYFDAFLTSWVVRPFVRVFECCDKLERRWTDFLSGGPSRELELPQSPTRTLDDLL
jgi:NAD(P)H-quinone oxidoreductase subunit 5